jgi:hypothetical protein
MLVKRSLCSIWLQTALKRRGRVNQAYSARVRAAGDEFVIDSGRADCHEFVFCSGVMMSSMLSICLTRKKYIAGQNQMPVVVAHFYRNGQV